MPRWSRIAVALALVPAALALLGGGAAAASASCAPAGARLLRTSTIASLYTQGGELYGCLGSRRTLLGAFPARRPAPGTRISRYILAGRYAATDAVAMGVDTLSSTVSLTDLASGASLRAPATGPERRAESFTSVLAMALDRRGVLAWIGRRSAIGVVHPTFEVHVLSAAGSVWVTAGGRRPTALRVRGSRVSWRGAGGRARQITA